MKSMRIFLVSTILAVVTLFSFITALRGYQTSLEEADRLFDSQLIAAFWKTLAVIRQTHHRYNKNHLHERIYQSGLQLDSDHKSNLEPCTDERACLLERAGQYVVYQVI